MIRGTFDLAPGATLVASVLALAATTATAGGLSQAALDEVRDRIRAHQLTTLDGRPFAMDDATGDVVVVSLWATWCKPCQRELPVLDALHARIADRGARVLAIAIDRDRDRVARFVVDRDLTLPVFHDGPNGLVKDLDLDFFPVTFVLDRSGHVAYWTRETSDASLSALESRVAALVDEPRNVIAEGGQR